MIKVQPKYKSYQPKYPSYLDKNPLKYPETMPYPFTDKMVDFLAKIGFVGALVLSPMVGDAQIQDSVELYNPFTKSALNLPFVATEYGTGVPMRLSSQNAISAINNAFSSEGLITINDKIINNDSLKIGVTAYNNQYKIGYIFVDWDNVVPELCVRCLTWSDPISSEEEYKLFLNDSESFFKKYLALRKILFPKIKKFKKEKDKQKFFFDKFYAYQIEKGLKKLKDFQGFTPNFRKWFQELNEILLQKEVASFLQRLYSIDSYFGVDSFKQILENEATSILKENRKQNKIARSRQLITLLNSANGYNLDQSPFLKKKFIDILNDDWKNRDISLFEDAQDLLHVSENEIDLIIQHSKSQDFYITPISSNNENTILNEDQIYLDRSKVLSKTEFEEYNRLIKAYYATNNTEKHKKLKTSLAPLDNKFMIAQKKYIKKIKQERKIQSMKRLENDVRMYIQWAKAQQGY